MATDPDSITTRPALVLLPADRPDPRTCLGDLVAPYRLSLLSRKRRERGVRTEIYTLRLFLAWVEA